MPIKIQATYLGDYQVSMTHAPSQDSLNTDLPIDNGGQGRTFSPSDLIAAAQVSCILTILGKLGTADGVDLKSTSASIEKHMTDAPRRIGKLLMHINFPAGLSEEKKKQYVAIVAQAPIPLSLHPEIELTYAYT